MPRRIRVASVWLTAALPAALAAAGSAGPLVLESPNIAAGRMMAASQVYDRSGCGGRNLSPSLSWAHPPAGTRSFAVLMFDPDAPTGVGWWHWVVFDIPASVRALPAGAGNPARHLLPAGAIQTSNDFGSLGYGGPCPPPGPPHHYRVTLYALKVAKLGLDARARPARVAARVRASAIAEAQIVALYGR